MRAAAPLNALPDSDFAVKRLVEGLPSDQDIFYRLTARRPRRHQRHVGADRRPFPHRAGVAPQRPLRLVGRHRRPGLGHRRGRHEDLRHDGRARAGLLHPFRRHDLCRRPDGGRGRTRRRRQVEEHVLIDEKRQGRRDARRVSRAVEVQHARRACPRLQRRRADLLPVGRPRGDEQLVGRQGPARRRPLPGQVDRAALARAPAAPSTR